MPSVPVTLCAAPGSRGDRTSPQLAATSLPQLNSPQTKEEAHLGKRDLVSHSIEFITYKVLCIGM